MESEKKTETSRSIIRNMLYGFTTWVLPLVLSFVGTPIIVKHLGDKDYGIYALVMGFIIYSFYFNFGRAITKYIAEYKISGDNHKIRDIVSATLFINLIVGVFGVAIVYGIADWLVISVFQIDPVDQRKTVYALYVAGLIVFFSMLSQIFNSILQGIHRFDVYSNIFNVNSVMIVGGNIILVLYGYSLLALLIWNVIITFLTCLVVAIASRRLLPEFGINFKVGFSTYKLVLTYSAGIVGYQFLSNLLVLFERGWITRQLGAGSLTFYVVPMLITIYVHAFISSIMMVIFPLASELKYNKEKLLKLYLKASKIVVILVVFMAMSLIVEGKTFLALWMSMDFADKSYVILSIHTVTFSLVAIQIVSWQMIEGLGYPSYNLIIFVVCLIINVSLMIYLTPALENVGVALSRLGGFGTIFLSVFYVEKWIFGKVQFKFWLQLIIVLSLSACAGALVENYIVDKLGVNWIGFISAITAGGIVYCSIVWMLKLISEEERVLIKNLIRR